MVIRSWGRGASLAGLIGIPCVFLSALFYFPLFRLLSEVLQGAARGAAFTLLFDPYFWRLLRFTAGQAAWSALASLAIGFPLAYVLANYDFPLRRAVRSLTMVPFVLPAIVVSLGFILFFGHHGALNRALGLFGLDVPLLYSLPAIILAHAFYNAPVVARSVHAAWERLDPAYEESARSLGAGRWAVFRDVTLPMILPGLVTGSLLSFLFSFMSFPIVLSLGGARFSTLEVEIYTQVRVLLDYSTGAAFAFWETLFALSFSFLYLRIERRWAYEARLRGVRPLRPLRLAWRSVWLIPYAAFVLLLYLGPVLSVVADSFTAETTRGARFSLGAYRQILQPGHSALLGDSPLAAVRNSLLFGLGTAAVTLPLGILFSLGLARRRFAGGQVLEILALAPLAVSSVAFGFAMLRAARLGPLRFLAPEATIILAHAVLAFPFVVRSLRPLLTRFDRSLREAARSLGASPWRAFRDVELPLIAAGFLVSAVFAFAMSLSEMSATIMLARPGLSTMPLAVYQLLASRQFGTASAMAVILIVMTGAAFVVVERVAETWLTPSEQTPKVRRKDESL